jgi:hypothetical protein
MPRGLILISASCPYQVVATCLNELQGDIGFISQNHAVIETWCPCMGNADYAVRVFGFSLESVRLASGALRTKLTTLAGPGGRVSTNTIVGSSMLDMMDPSGASRFRALAPPTATASADGVTPDERAAAASRVVHAAVCEALCSLEIMVRAATKGHPQNAKELASLLSAIQSCCQSDRRVLMEQTPILIESKAAHPPVATSDPS